MKISNLEPYVIADSSTVQAALEKINSNKQRILFLVDNNGCLTGSFTDGDLRRWLLRGNQFENSITVAKLCNKEVKSVKSDDVDTLRESHFNNGKHIIPVVNQKNQVLYFLAKQKLGFFIADQEISNTSRPFIIAEIGNNHQGCIDTAKKLVSAVCDAGVQCVKFQMRSMKKLYGSEYTSGSDSHDLGSQYTLDLLEKFQLTDDELFEVFDFSKELGLIPLCTPWDIASLSKLENYDMPAYKVASADLTNYELLSALSDTGKPLICSTGMSTEEEIVETVKYLDRKNANFILLHCNSTYPTPYKDINLKYISRLEKLSGRPVGYSGHERGIHVPIAACALGAKIIEKHVTFDKDQQGTDHKVSLLPSELKEMSKQIMEVHISMGSGAAERTLTQGEMINRQILAKSIFVNRNISKGERIIRSDLYIRGPGRGLQPNMLEKVIGINANRDIPTNTELFDTDLTSEIVKKASYQIFRPHGIPVRFHDYRELVSNTTIDFVEFHLSYGDMNLDHSSFLRVEEHLGFAVHCPELFAGDHLLDLTSENESYRKLSIKNLNETIKLTHELKKYFPKAKTPTLIVNTGGWSREGFFNEEKKARRYKILQESLQEIDRGGINFAIQTMPPFPWHFGGQSYHNLFVDPEEIKEFCDSNSSVSICLDTSHSMMACKYFGWDLNQFIDLIAPHISYIHLADSLGVDGEGIEFGKGDINFKSIMNVLDQINNEIPFIPEVWQGHINNGAGFWAALEFVEDLYQN